MRGPAVLRVPPFPLGRTTPLNATLTSLDRTLRSATGEVFQRFYSEAPPAVFVDPAGQLSPAIAFRGLAELFSPSPPALARFDVLEADTT